LVAYTCFNLDFWKFLEKLVLPNFCGKKVPA
jgi:hypothetical protein